MKALRYSILPVVVGVASLFAVLPHRGADVTVRIVDVEGGFGYTPGSVTLEPGQRVAFVNETKQTHTASCQGCPWTTGDIQPSQTKFVTFKQDLASTFACRYHPDSPAMQGVMVVGTPDDATNPGSTG